MELKKICSFIKENVYFNLFLIIISFWIGITFSSQGSILYIISDFMIKKFESPIEVQFLIELIIILYCITIYFSFRIIINLILKVYEYYSNK